MAKQIPKKHILHEKKFRESEKYLKVTAFYFLL